MSIDELLDYFYTILHLVIIGFNMLGWIPSTTRRIHFISVVLTAASWLILGIWYGLGYCPITDWQWQIKERLWEQNLPNSFIKYHVDMITASDFSSSLIDIITASGFAIAAVLSISLNFFKKRKRRFLQRPIGS